MSGFAGQVRSRALGVLRRGLFGAAPTSSRPAEPLRGALGPAAFRGDGEAGGPEVTVPERWEAETAREPHLHAWFAELARRHAAGDAEAAARAVNGLTAWLRHDQPGVGPGWEHPSDLTTRLVNQAAGFAWLGTSAPPELCAAAAGSAAWHVTQLRARLPLGRDDGHRRLAHHVGLLVAGLTFPAIPDARRTWADAACALGPALAELVFADGSDRGGAPAWLERSLWLAAIAMAVARTNGVALPSEATAAWSRGVRFLDRLAGDLDTLPPLGEAPPFAILPAPGSLPAALRSLSAHWGLDDAEAAREDRRLRWFGATAPQWAFGGARGGSALWAAWSFHEDGVAIATLPVRSERMRVLLSAQSRSGGPFAHEAPLQLLVDVGTRPLLADPGPGVHARAEHDGLVLRGAAMRPARLDVARVDGKKARLEGHAPLASGGRWCRDVLLNQQRVIVTDRLEGAGGEVSLCWRLGPDWQIEGADRAWTLRAGPFTVVVELPAGLSWRREGAGWRGTGPLLPGAELRSSFEVR